MTADPLPLSSHSSRAGPALRALVESDPAIAALSLWCIHRDGARTETNGTTISYGADFPELALHEQIGLAAHHILHVALRHPARLDTLKTRLGEGFDADLYNLCADALINEALLLADHGLPRPAVTLTGLLSGTLGPPDSPQAALGEWDVDRLYFALSGGSSGKAEKGARGAGEGNADDTRARAEAYARQAGFTSDVSTAPGETEDQDQVTEDARWRQHLSRALETGRAAGRGLGRIGHRILDIPQPRTPWELILRRSLTRALTRHPELSPYRPARRWIARAAEAASLERPTPGFEAGQKQLREVPRIVLAIDASGSIDNPRLDLFWAEVSGIARRLNAELHMMVFDDDIRHTARLDPSQTRFAWPDLPRGGGTAFRPVIEASGRLNASALVILTDLDGDAGPVPPATLRVIWAVPDAAALQAPFGQLVDLSH